MTVVKSLTSVNAALIIDRLAAAEGAEHPTATTCAIQRVDPNFDQDEFDEGIDVLLRNGLVVQTQTGAYQLTAAGHGFADTMEYWE